MTADILPSPTDVAAPLTPADLAIRTRANAIDCLIGAGIVVASDLITVVWGFFLSDGRLFTDGKLGSVLAISSLAYLIMAIAIGYWLTSHLIARHGTTPGHWLLGLRIITPDNRERAAMLRTAVPFLLYVGTTTCALIAYQFSVYGTGLPMAQYNLWLKVEWGFLPGLAAILVWHGVGAWLAYRDPRRRTLADRLAGTVVVVVRCQERRTFLQRFPRGKIDLRTWVLVKWLPRVMGAQSLCIIMLFANLGFWSMIMLFPIMGLGLIPVPLGLVLILHLVDCGRIKAAIVCGTAVAFEMPLCLVSVDLWRDFVLNCPPFVMY